MGSSLKPMAVSSERDPSSHFAVCSQGLILGFFLERDPRLHVPAIGFANMGSVREGRSERSSYVGMVVQVSCQGCVIGFSSMRMAQTRGGSLGTDSP